MNCPRLLRALRITCTVFCATACILFVALWVRSYYFLDVLPSMSGPNISSLRGQISVNQRFNYTGVCDCLPKGVPKGFSVLGYVIRCDSICLGEAEPLHSRPTISDWAIVGIAFTLGAGPWLPWMRWFPWSCRFSLRTLLITVTAVGVVLGLIVYLAR